MAGPVTVVIGVDGAGRTHRLDQIAGASTGPVVRINPPLAAAVLPTAWADGSVVLIDDPHRLTVDDLRALTGAARGGVAMVLARRPTIDSVELADLDEAVSGRGQVEVLAPLDAEGVRALITTVTGVAPSRGQVDLVHAASGGLPAVAAAIADTVIAEPDPVLAGAAGGTSAGGGTAAGGGPAGSPRLTARLQRRLARLDSPVARLVRVLALGLDLADPILAAASEVGADGLAIALRSVRDEGLLMPAGERLIPAVAQALLADLPAAERRRVHEAVARALIGQGSDVMVAGAQLRAARVFLPAAAPIYLAVADRLRFGTPAAALGWYDDAVEAGADPAEVVAGRAEAAALVGLPVDTTPPAGTGPAASAARQRLTLVDGAVEAHDGRTDRSAQTLLAAAPPGPTLAVPGLVAGGRRPDDSAGGRRPDDSAGGRRPDDSAGGRRPDDSAGGRRPDDSAGLGGDRSERDPDPPTTAGGPALRRLADAAIVLARDPAAAVPLLIEAAELVERAAPAVVLPDTPHALAAIAAAGSGDLTTAELLLTRAMAAGVGGPVALARHRLLLAFVRLRSGRYDTAVAELTELASAPLAGRERLLLAALSAGVARRSGDVARLREAWTTVEPVLARRTVDLFTAEAVEELAVAAARLRRRSRVEPVLAALDGIVERLGSPPAWLVTVGWIRVQVAVAEEDGAAVAAAVQGFPANPPGARQQAQWVAARRWADVLGGVVDPDAVVAAGEALAQSELPWEASRLVGQAAIRTTDAAAARRLLERARDLSSAEVTAADTRTEPVHGGLSEREVEVARMVLDGGTYREIGARLFISPKTVEHHVARIRTKLGATTRAEFVAALRTALDVA